MKKTFYFSIILLILLILAGCAGKKDDTPNISETGRPAVQVVPQTDMVSAAPTEEEIAALPELKFRLYYRYVENGSQQTTNGPSEEPERPWIVPLSSFTGVTVRFDSKIDIEEMKRCVSPQGDEVTLWTDQVYADAVNLTGEKKVVVKKGLRSLDGRVLKDDLVLDFTAREWQVRIQRIDPVTGEKLPNSNTLGQSSVTMLLTFDSPADRASVEKSVRENVFIPGHQSNGSDPLPEPYPQPKLTFEWKSDSECKLTVEELREQYWYWINLKYAHAENGSAILWNANYGSVPTAKPDQNYAYSFQLSKPGELMAMNLAAGTERELISFSECFGVGPASPDGRYLAVSTMWYADELFSSTEHNLAVLDTLTGKIQYDFDAYAHLQDETQVGNDGKLVRNGRKQSPDTEYYFEQGTGEDVSRVCIKNKSGKVIYITEQRCMSYNAYWLKNGLVAYRGYEHQSVNEPAVFVIDKNGNPVKTMSGYQLVDVSADGGFIAVERNNIITVYTSDWVKKDEIDIKKLTGEEKDEEFRTDIRSIVTPLWGKDKMYLFYLRQKGNGYITQLCIWDFVGGTTEDKTFSDHISPLLINQETGELIYSTVAFAMRHSFNYSD